MSESTIPQIISYFQEYKLFWIPWIISLAFVTTLAVIF